MIVKQSAVPGHSCLLTISPILQIVFDVSISTALEKVYWNCPMHQATHNHSIPSTKIEQHLSQSLGSTGR
jgi:hypothetical protein